jgi:phosphatidylglycerol:prolipoprotein diacylglycerol transferase
LHPLIPYFEQPILEIPLPDGLPWDAIPLHGFGLLVAAGFLVGARVAMNRARRLGLDPEQINKLIGWLVIGTFVGGHVGYGLMYKPAEYLADPRQFLYMWQGLSSFGGFLVCVPLTVLFFYKNKLPFWSYADCIAYGLTVGWFFGRMGCFVAHDHPGTPTNFFLGVYGICATREATVACHDMGLYEALWAIGTFGVFWLLDKRPHVPGFFPLMLGLLYAPVRVLMDFARPESTDERYLGFTPAQYLATLCFVLCAVLLVKRLQSKDTPVWTPPGTVPPEIVAPGQKG